MKLSLAQQVITVENLVAKDGRLKWKRLAHKDDDKQISK